MAYQECVVCDTCGVHAPVNWQLRRTMPAGWVVISNGSDAIQPCYCSLDCAVVARNRGEVERDHALEADLDARYSPSSEGAER